MSDILLDPKVKKKPKIEVDISPIIAEESQVIVHCHYRAQEDGEGIRIWPTTYLLSHQSDHVSKLVHAEKITMYPQWTWLPKGDFAFTLIFSGLPRSCMSFDLVEDCQGAPGSFLVPEIRRTEDDVYYIDI